MEPNNSFKPTCFARRLNSGVGTHERRSRHAQAGRCNDLRDRSRLVGSCRNSERVDLAIGSQFRADEISASGVGCTLPACSRVVVVVAVCIGLWRQRFVGSERSLAPFACRGSVISRLGCNGASAHGGLLRLNAWCVLCRGSRVPRPGVGVAGCRLVAHSPAGSTVRCMRPNKRLVPNRNGEAPLLAAQRRR